jgi:hypothetical protein
MGEGDHDQEESNADMFQIAICYMLFAICHLPCAMALISHYTHTRIHAYTHTWMHGCMDEDTV